MATRTVSASKKLWTNFVHFEAGIGGRDRLMRVSGVYAAALSDDSALCEKDKSELWEHKLVRHCK